MVGVVEHHLLNVLGQLDLGQEVHWTGSHPSKIKHRVSSLVSPLVSLILVIVGTTHIFVAIRLFAVINLVDQRVVNLLLPAMAVGAECLQDAPFVVVSDESAYLPVLTQITRVVVE